MAPPLSRPVIQAVETENGDQSHAEGEADERWRLGNADGAEGGGVVGGRNVANRGSANSHRRVEGVQVGRLRVGRLRTGGVEFCEPGVDPGSRGSAGEAGYEEFRSGRDLLGQGSGRTRGAEAREEGSQGDCDFQFEFPAR